MEPTQWLNMRRLEEVSINAKVDERAVIFKEKSTMFFTDTRHSSQLFTGVIPK
jgi:hypothetical protein